VKYRSFDGAGNKSPIRAVLVKIDKTAPTISFATLRNHERVTGKVLMGVKVSDLQSKTAKVLFYVDGRLLATDTRASFSFLWNTRKASRHQHTLKAKAVDRAGNRRATSIVVTIG
jgi:hypothetical protein